MIILGSEYLKNSIDVLGLRAQIEDELRFDIAK